MAYMRIKKSIKLNFCLIALFFTFSLLSIDNRNITVGVISNNDRENYSIPYAINSIIPMILNLAITDVKKQFPKAEIKVKYFYFQKEAVTSRLAIDEALKDKDVQLVFGPFGSRPVTDGRDLIDKGDLLFISQANTSNLKGLKNYYTPLEWQDRYAKTVIDYAIEYSKKDKPKVAALILWNRTTPRDFYTIAQNYLKSNILLKRIYDNQFNYDEAIKDILEYKPDIILNPNYKSISSLFIKLLFEKGYNGIIVGNSSWGCGGRQYIFRNRLRGIKYLGFSPRQNPCLFEITEEEKKFKDSLLGNLNREYGSLFAMIYWAIKHSFTVLLKSKLELTRGNVSKIISSHAYFKGYGKKIYRFVKDNSDFNPINIYEYSPADKNGVRLVK